MIKRTQNKVAESRFTLPVVMAYAIAVWLASGLLLPSIPFSSNILLRGAWVQFVSFLLSAFLMVELNNGNALIRIYSRMVSSSFIVLACAANMLFGSMAGAIVQLCVVASLTTFFHSYQDKQSMGWIFYTFLFIGLASTVFVQILYYVPFFWLMMQIQLASFGWRTFWASLIGLLTPYWFILPVAIYQEEFGRFVTHFEQLAVFQLPDYSLLTVNQVVIFAFVVTLALTGSIHYWRNSLSDKFRIRQLYGCFTVLTVVTIAFIVAQPQHFQALMHILIIATSPLIGHFLALTYTRITNYAFYVICAAALLITLLNLWMPSLSF